MAAQGWRLHPVTLLASIWPGVSSLFGGQGWLLSPLVFVAFAAVAWRETGRFLETGSRSAA